MSKDLHLLNKNLLDHSNPRRYRIDLQIMLYLRRILFLHANSSKLPGMPVCPCTQLQQTVIPREPAVSSYEARPRYSTPVTRPLRTVESGTNSVVTYYTMNSRSIIFRKSSCPKKPQTVMYFADHFIVSQLATPTLHPQDLVERLLEAIPPFLPLEE